MLKQLRKKTKILLITAIVLVGLCVVMAPKAIIYEVRGKEHHYTGRYNVIKKDLDSNDKLGYLISDGLVDPFYKDEYYYELGFDFKYKTKTQPYMFIGENDKKGIIEMDDFSNNAKWNLELYDYHTDKKIKTINLYPILKNKLKGLYFLEGFSDSFLTKENGHLIFNLPLREELIKGENIKNLSNSEGEKSRILVKVNLDNKQVSFAINHLTEEPRYAQYLSQMLVTYARRIKWYTSAYPEEYMVSYDGHQNKNYDMYIVYNLFAYYKILDDKSSSIEKHQFETFKVFPDLKKYIRDKLDENKLLVIYEKK